MKLTKFQQDYQEILECGDYIGILTERKEEIKKLENELRRCKNEFRAKCIIQDLRKMNNEYNILNELL